MTPEFSNAAAPLALHAAPSVSIHPSWSAAVLLKTAQKLGWVREQDAYATSVCRFLCGVVLGLIMGVVIGASTFMMWNSDRDYPNLLTPLTCSGYWFLSILIRTGSFGIDGKGLGRALQEFEMPPMRNNFVVATALWIGNVLVNLHAAAVFGESEQLLGTLFQHPMIVALWALALTVDICGLISTVALLNALTMRLSAALTASHRSLAQGDASEARHLYGVLMDLRERVQPVYAMIGLPMIGFSVCGIALFLSEEVVVWTSKEAGAYALAANWTRRCWLVTMACTIVWVATPAAELSRHHNKFMILAVRTAFRDGNPEHNFMLSGLSIMNDKFGLKLAGQVVTHRFLWTLISSISVIVGGVRYLLRI